MNCNVCSLSWSDQGAFTGRMTKVPVSFFSVGRRWFSGKRPNQGYERLNFPHLYDEDGMERGDRDLYDDDSDDTDLDEDNVNGY